MLNYIAFLGTGPCNRTDMRNANIAQLVIFVLTILFIVFISRNLIKRTNTWLRVLGWISVPFAVFIAFTALAIIAIGTACNGTYE
ncbi:MAG: hypothetical protein U0520_01335 [Candidatus Saccharimonadales bacterium]